MPYELLPTDNPRIYWIEVEGKFYIQDRFSNSAEMHNMQYIYLNLTTA